MSRVIFGSGERHAIYLRCEPDDVFAILHLPPQGVEPKVGVVMCPSFGWEDYNTHRAKRTWADVLASAGHPTIRLDLPGTGDSAGSSRDPDRPAAWISAVAAAASYLRTEAGCGRVAGFGIGFGGMLAWLAANEGAPIDDLMLWATPVTGRRLLRETRAAAMMSIDDKLEFASDRDAEICSSAKDSADDLLDEAGQITTAETIESLSRLDLTASALSNPAKRRVLVFMRSGHEADESVRSFFTEIGSEVTEADGDGYGALMQYVQHSKVPERAVAESVAWLDSSAAKPLDSPLSEPLRDVSSHEATSDRLETDQDGIAILERPLTLEVDGTLLSGVVTEPVGVPARGICAVFFSGGSDRRTGPNRMWVETSRRWAAQGVHAVRVDPPGIGDSDGDERFWDELSAHYDPGNTEWAVRLLDVLGKQGLPQRYVLSGFCAGAYRSFHVGMVDTRVVGMFAIGLPFFFWTWWTLKIRDWWTVDWVPRPTDTWKKTALVRLIQRGIATASYLRLTITRLSRPGPDRSERALQELTSRGTEVLVLFKAGSHELRDLTAAGRIDRFRAIPHVEILRIPGDDMRFRPVALQHYINTAMDDALARVIAATATSDTTPNALAGCRQQT